MVVPEVGAIGDHHGAVQHVAVAEGRPGIANIIGAAEHLDAMLLQELKRWDRGATWPMAHDGDAEPGQHIGRAGGAVHRNGT